MTSSVALGRTVVSLALAPGEARLALTGDTDVVVVRTSDLTREGAVRMVPSGTSNCVPQPYAVAFKGNDRVLA